MNRNAATIRSTERSCGAQDFHLDTIPTSFTETPFRARRRKSYGYRVGSETSNGDLTPAATLGGHRDPDRAPLLHPEASDAQRAARHVAEHDRRPDAGGGEPASRLEQQTQ